MNSVKQRICFAIGLVAMFGSLALFANFGAFEDASWTKLWILVAIILSASIGLALTFNPNQIWLNVCRYFSGILFVFSGNNHSKRRSIRRHYLEKTA